MGVTCSCHEADTYLKTHCSSRSSIFVEDDFPTATGPLTQLAVHLRALQRSLAYQITQGHQDRIGARGRAQLSEPENRLFLLDKAIDKTHDSLSKRRSSPINIPYKRGVIPLRDLKALLRGDAKTSQLPARHPAVPFEPNIVIKPFIRHAIPRLQRRPTYNFEIKETMDSRLTEQPFLEF